MRVLLVENECSFSWNIVDCLPVDRSEVEIVPGADKAALRRHLHSAEVVVVGSGPLDPTRADLVGIVAAADARGLPVLGICLGHQAVGQCFGARLAPTVPHHGMRSTARFEVSRLFPGITGPVEVMRYHSLALDHVPSPLRVVARSEDGVVMAIEHDFRPLAGVQFHPDSFGTPRGEEIVAAFFSAVCP